MVGLTARRFRRPLLGLGLAAALAVVATVPAPAARAGGGFTAMAADATFGVDMTFSATWTGGAPDRVELLLGFGDETRLVVPIAATGDQLAYRRDLTDEYVPPNTTVAYRWRAVVGAEVTVSAERTLLYDDDRPGLSWESARIGSATVFWYGANESIARRFGALAGDAADAAGELLGQPLAEPIDIFVYDDRAEFIGAVGEATREWVGAATYPSIRTVFMWLGAGSDAFLETAIAHEVTHVVFDDATANPFHVPPAWLNEGVATWSELGSADTERDLVRQEARTAEGLMAFEALTDQFPIDARGANLAYAQGATMVDDIIAGYGPDAVAGIASAYRAGTTDDEAIEAGTGVTFDQLTAEFFASFGVDEPAPVTAQPLDDSDVALPPQPGEPTTPDDGDAGGQDLGPWLIIGAVLIGVVLVAVLTLRARRATVS